jgi:hypothetical protein
VLFRSRRYPDTVEVRTTLDGSSRCAAELARCRPNHADLDRVLGGYGIPDDVIAATVERVLVLLADEDRRWAVYERAACEAERTSDVVLDVHQDDSHVWWIASVTYAATGRDVPRDADEGGTLPTWQLARAEGLARAERPGRTVIYIGCGDEYRAYDRITGWRGPVRVDQDAAAADAAAHNASCQIVKEIRDEYDETGFESKVLIEEEP